jgi:hypothetical protein
MTISILPGKSGDALLTNLLTLTAEIVRQGRGNGIQPAKNAVLNFSRDTQLWSQIQAEFIAAQVAVRKAPTRNPMGGFTVEARMNIFSLRRYAIKPKRA